MHVTSVIGGSTGAGKWVLRTTSTANSWPGSAVGITRSRLTAAPIGWIIVILAELQIMLKPSAIGGTKFAE